MSRPTNRSAATPALGGLQQRLAAVSASRLPLVAWAVLVAAGTGLLVCAMVPTGPDWLGVVGSVTIGATYAWALAARTGGRPVVFGALALAIGLLAVWAEQDLLSTGAAVLVTAEAAVLGVMATVPAQSFLRAARECAIGMVIAGIGAMAAVGFEPAIDVTRFEYLGLGLALVAAEVLVFRLGAGLHGLGRRGVLVVAIGAALLLATLLYAELLRRYGSTGLVDWLLDRVDWSRDQLGAFPRPIVAVLGVPALAYGCHMRARRRQGWWVCAFGVAATSPVATSLGNPAVGLSEVVLSEVYGLLVGLVLAYVVIRLDLALTGNAGRRSRVAEQAAAVRPEPRRTAALL
ncbi:hypothetical protein DJ010_09655 [Nocardioides silvaticus]|uniref:Uncharacterized protein n=1 Tax=Nocardioides silvaticus TaxID=2201891 RepID=A0A316TM24_9ACTN|nr:hypothetical protein [Nocardioides silvaticus]PWN03362.1 hypothetical protein DJ010_09655 [Nocardioides silvaticus]